jgi:hypothetical protein
MAFDKGNSEPFKIKENLHLSHPIPKFLCHPTRDVTVASRIPRGRDTSVLYIGRTLVYIGVRNID